MKRAAALPGLVLALFAFVAPPAVAQTEAAALQVLIREIDFQDDGRTRLVVSVSGAAIAGQQLGPESFSVTEAGVAVGGLAARPFLQNQEQAVVVALVMDVSGSTVGIPLAAAKQGARALIERLPAGTRMAVVAFSNDARLVTGFTDDRAALTAAVDGLSAGGGTALYDGLHLAARTLAEREPNAQHNIVLFSDGRDTSSDVTLDEAVATIRVARAPAAAVLLRTADADEAALRRVARASSGGRFVTVRDTGGLAAAFEAIAESITSQYVLTYTSAATSPRELNIQVTANVGGFTDTDQSIVINERATVTPGRPAAAPKPPPLEDPIVPFFGSRIGFIVGIAAAFTAALLLFGVLLWAPQRKRAERLLARGLKMYTRGAAEQRRTKKQEGSQGFLGSTAFGRRAVDLVERAPRREKSVEKLQALIERAGWPLRSSELIIIQLAGAAVGVVLGLGLFRSPILAVMLLGVGAALPRMLLQRQVDRRASHFLEQLPDTLQLLAGSLQAGYAFMQALDTVAKEASPPTSTEFSRVLAESRLGMPLEEALDAMAERVGGEDFRWVVMAINIQRQAGGNLAQLLNTVAETLRDREQVRRQVKVLSAEGRLSAVILTALPFVLVGYLSVVNPQYLSQLFSESGGRMLVVIGLVLIGLGVVWLRKLIRIEV